MSLTEKLNVSLRDFFPEADAIQFKSEASAPPVLISQRLCDALKKEAEEQGTHSGKIWRQLKEEVRQS